MRAWQGFEKERVSWDYTTFNSNELAAIAGISQTLQRGWRNRGLLPGGSGRSAIFSSRDVAEILVRYQLSLNGVAASESVEIGRIAAQNVLFAALLNADGACEVKGSNAAVDEFIEQFDHDDRIAAELAGHPDFAYYLWRGDGGKLALVADVAKAIDEKRFISHFVFDLEIAADQLVERAAKPLVTIVLPPVSGQARTRRLSIGRDEKRRASTNDLPAPIRRSRPAGS